MTFSQSFELGNSTFMKLESEVNHAISDENAKEKLLDVISESPTSAAVPPMRSRFFTPDLQSRKVENTASHKCKSSKFYSTMAKSSNQSHQSAADNYSRFFQSDFSIPNDITQYNTSVLRISQIEAAFKDDYADDDIPDRSINNFLEKPVFSEDLNEFLETTESEIILKDVLPSSTQGGYNEYVNESVLHDTSSYICPIEDNILREELLNKELNESRRILKEFQQEQENVSARNINLSCMSQDQLKFSPELSPIEKKKTYSISCSDVKYNSGIQNVRKKGTEIIKTVLENKSTAKLVELKSMTAWNLPLSILNEYERKGVKNMFDWQIECLSKPRVLFEHCNLVYSAPTSAGKTLVSEILLLKTVLERGKKVLLILPFISVVREKMFYLQDLLTAAGYRVEGFFGGYSPPGGFDSINVAICTIEKANSIINRLLEQGKLDEIGTIVVDEVHLISDPGRGYILELLLAKVLYMSRKYGLQIQIITMSATLANVELLRKWLDAELYITNYRPVALQEMIKIGSKIYDTSLNFLRSVTEASGNVIEPFPELQNDADHVAQLCIETLVDGCSVIVFCPSKDWCENLATQLAGAIHSLGKQGGDWGLKLRAQVNREAIDIVKQQLRDIPTGLDAVLEKCITYGCSFHHAGLTTEERDILEASFKTGALRVIVATSTLSSGVNLPARRVLIRSPLFGGKQMSSLTYRQMIGRAGRTGKDVLGESILICTESNSRVGKELITADLKPLKSCLDLDSSTHLKRALLEVISSGVATSKEDINNFVNCTLLSAQNELTTQEKENNQQEIADNAYIGGALDFLIEYEFVRLQTDETTQEQHYVATQLGNACLASSVPPTDGLILFAELQKSRRCFVLESELHAVYLVTPYSVCYQLQDLDWLLYLDLWEKLPSAMRKVGELVGVKESFLVRAMRGQSKLDYKLMQIHKRFYTALALQELVNETPINKVAFKYKCTRGMLQGLQQMASTFAGIVTSFCNSLQWDTLSLIVSQFKERLYFGIHRDLIDLMRLPDLNHKRARALYDAGLTSLIDLAGADILSVEKILHNILSFDSVKKHENENEFEANKRNEARNFFITGKVGLTVAEAAKLLVQEARRFVEFEIGAGNINWSQSICDKDKKANDTKNQIHISFEEHNYHNTITRRNVEVVSDAFENKEPVCDKSKADKIIQNTTRNSTASLERNKKDEPENFKNLTFKENICKTEISNVKCENRLEENLNIPENLTTERELGSDKTNDLDQNNVENSANKRKSLDEISNVTPPKVIKTSNEVCSKIKSSKVVEKEAKTADAADMPGTSKKAQRLLKAKQLSELKKQEWAKRNDLKQNASSETKGIAIEDLKAPDHAAKSDKTLKKSSPKNLSNTPKIQFATDNPITPKLPRRSPRNHLISSIRNEQQTKLTKSQNNIKSRSDEKENKESFRINPDVKTTLKETNEVHHPEANINNSPDDEIPNSQQLVEEKPTANSNTPHSSRFLRSLRATQKMCSPRAKPSNETTKNLKPEIFKDPLTPPSSSSVDFSDFSSENSLLKNPIQLNASHILSCSKFETDSSSFKSLDIIDICGNQQLFKDAFKEFMSQKRLGFCLGLQKLCEKRKPIIGSNLLLNQVAASEKERDDAKTYEFQIDDANYLSGISFCISENVVYYMNMQQNGSCTELTSAIKCKYVRMLLRSSEHTLLVYDAKDQMKILRKVFTGIGEIDIAAEDPKVANWLLQPDKNYNLFSLAQQFAPECSSLVKLCGSGRGFNSYGLDSESTILAKVRSSIEACVTVHILKGQIENLERIGTGQLYKFFTELEMPLQMSLCNMEHIGFPANSEALHKLFQQMVDSMKKVESKIYEMHGSRFNLGSSSAVSRVLGLHRQTNGRISTSKQILEKIDSPISQMIITYRKLSATLTKNIQPLLKCVKNDRIHGQSITITSTGRISMNEPNLQNVARDFDFVIDSQKYSISCRSAFFPADPRRCLISSDFCQLEMRILAHLSQDSALLQVMKSDKDLFVAIASRWNKISESGVTEQLRNGTKQICYGIVYGMGMRALAEALKCTEQEAKIVSEQFHAAYPGIRQYAEKVLRFARNNGYIETITGRRRYLDNICSEEGLMKNQAERQAVNSTIQGSAADIAKSAILRMEKNIIKYREKLGLEPDAVRLVLHLHDELIFEVPEEKSKKIAKVLSLTMENCVKLNVPLKVKLKIGKSWGELKEVKL